MTMENSTREIRELVKDERYDYITIGNLRFDRQDFVSVESEQRGADEMIAITLKNEVVKFSSSSVFMMSKAREMNRERFDSLMKDDSVKTMIIYHEKDVHKPTIYIEKKDIISCFKSPHDSMATIVRTANAEIEVKFGYVASIDALLHEKKEIKKSSCSHVSIRYVDDDHVRCTDCGETLPNGEKKR